MKNFLTGIFILLIANSVLSQSVQINDVRNKEFRGVYSVEGKGFYTFYLNEKVGKGMREFNLELFDLNLKRIKKTPIQITKNSIMQGGEFDGEDFMFVFYDLSKKINTYVTIDGSGNIIKKKTIESKKGATVASVELYPAKGGNGFYVTKTVKEKKWGYEITKYDRSLTKLWTKTVVRPKGIIGIETAESAEGRLVVVSAERPKLLSNKVTGKIVCYDDADGTEIYEYSLYNGTLTALPSSFLIEKDGSVVASGMYFDGQKWDATNSDGIFFAKLSPTGEKEIFNALDWDNGIQDALKATSRKFSIGSKPKVLFHEIVKNPDGGYQVVSETFRKTVKAGTVLAGALGSSAQDAPMGFTVMDYIIFNYDASGKPKDINKIEKPYKSITVDGSIANQGGVSLARYMQKYKMFTFEFMGKLNDGGQEVIVYTNFEDKGLGKGKPYLGISTIDQGQESRTRKVPLNKKYSAFVASSAANLKVGALEGNPGEVCLYFYDKKKKVVNLAIEELSMN